MTVMCHLTMGIHSEKCVIRLFCQCANITECVLINTNVGGIRSLLHTGLHGLCALVIASAPRATMIKTAQTGQTQKRKQSNQEMQKT